MKLLDTYALSCGAKIDKPFIYESYFPLPTGGKFITLQAQAPGTSRNYDYWQDVIDILNPTLSKYGIVIVQVGLPQEAQYQRVIDLRGGTNINQLAYLIRNSLLHFGPDSFCVHLASSFDTPIVALYSHSYVETAGPSFGSSQKQVLFKCYERLGNKKPSHAAEENPKSINTVKPEEIAEAIFKLLGITDYNIPFQTIYTGSRYTHMIIRELIPDAPNLLPLPDQPIEIRVDLHYDEKLLAYHLNYWQKAVIVTDKPISLALLKQFKPHIGMLAYHIPENDDPEFVKAVFQLGIPLVLVSRLPDEIIQTKKIKYYEYGAINRVIAPKPEVVAMLRNEPIESLYYRSCKLLAGNGKIHFSLPDYEIGAAIACDFEYRKVIDSPKFWQDIEFFTIVKKK